MSSEVSEWGFEIKPTSSLFDIKLKEVWKYRDLMLLFVKRDFVAQYKQTVLGPLWHFIQPILTTMMFVVVFGKIAKIPTGSAGHIIPPVLFYLSGLTIWNYFSACLINTSSTFTNNAAIFGKVYFPRLVLPISIVLSNMIKFFIQFLLLLTVLIYYQFHGYPIHLSISWLLIPLLVVIMAGIGLGAGIILSSLTSKYRDFSVLIGFGLQLLIYLSPVIYPLSYLESKGKYTMLIHYNPISPIIEGFKYAIFGEGYFNLYYIGYSLLVMIILLFLGIMYFSKVEKTFMDTV